MQNQVLLNMKTKQVEIVINHTESLNCYPLKRHLTEILNQSTTLTRNKARGAGKQVFTYQFAQIDSFTFNAI